MYDRLNIRGLVVEATIKAERTVDHFLTDFFCDNEFTGWELNEMLWYTERITLGSKKDILFILLDRYHKQFIADNPTFKIVFDSVVPHRNVFAHLEIETFENIGNDDFNLVFKKYKEGKLKHQKYNRKSVENIIADFNMIAEKLSALKTNRGLPL